MIRVTLSSAGTTQHQVFAILLVAGPTAKLGLAHRSVLSLVESAAHIFGNVISFLDIVYLTRTYALRIL